MSWPTIVIPWRFIAQANHRLLPVIRKGKVRLITAPEYRVAKQGAEYTIRSQWKGHAVSIPVALYARCYFPDKRKRDAGNLGKMLGDALTGIVLEDDSQIHRETYERTAVDRENPRVEITLEPLDLTLTPASEITE